MIRSTLALLAAVAAGALSGCGEESSAGAGAGEPVGVGQVRAGSVAALAQCSDWIEGTEQQRIATIADVRAQLNQANSSGPTPDLTDEEAYDLFERACAEDYAIGFRLYKLYARAAAFGSFSGQKIESSGVALGGVGTGARRHHPRGAA